MYQKYLTIIFLTTASCLGLLVAGAVHSNMITFDWKGEIKQAIQWQQKSKGVVCLPPVMSRDYKYHLFEVSGSNANVFILGSSTTMGIQQYHYPDQYRLLNLSINSNQTWNLISEAQFIAKKGPHPCLMIVGIDWALSWPFQPAPPSNTISSTQSQAPTTLQQVKDSYSLTRVKFLLEHYSRHAISFFRSSVDSVDGSYLTKSGLLAKDFAVGNPGSGGGFQPDGSATFEIYPPLTENELSKLNAQARQKSFHYAMGLQQQAGRLNPSYLLSLGEIANKLKTHGSRLVVLLPPLAPGVVKSIEEQPELRKYLESMQSQLNRWAENHEVTVVDASQSEEWGCRASHFLDGHHAFAHGYDKFIPRLMGKIQQNTLGFGYVLWSEREYQRPAAGRFAEQPKRRIQPL